MYDTDARHPCPTLETKLRALYGLRGGGRLEMGFRPAYLNLLKAFGQPHVTLPPVVHVAGTNGKGSTLAFLRAMLEAQSYRVHTYTSPHLVRFNERIILNGQEISDVALEALLDEAVSLNDGQDVTFFEITTAAAFAAFARTPADIVLLETGLGGRLDCTNVVPKPAATIIATISGDHREILGHSLASIAGEKAGIMKPGVPCVIGAQTKAGQAEGVEEVFETRARDLGVALFRYGTEWSSATTPDAAHMQFRFLGETQTLPIPVLSGLHQVANAGAALAALRTIESILPVSAQAQARGLRAAHWPARLQRLAESGYWGRQVPTGWEVWLDGGHNDSAGDVLATQAQNWAQADGLALHLVVGMMGSKHPAEFLTPLLPYIKSLSAVPIPDEGAALSPASILDSVPDFSEKRTFGSLEAALEALRAGPHAPTARVLICGSLYLAGSVLRAG